MKVHIKVAKYFYLKVPKLLNCFLKYVTKRRGEKSEIIIISPCKRKLHQDLEQIAKLTKNQIEPPKNKKQTKIETKTTTKTKKQKNKQTNFCQKINK